MAGTYELSSDYAWTDEHAWAAVEQSITRTLTGALVVQCAARVAGRPITLEPIDDTAAWMSRATLDGLRAWAAVPGLQMALALRGSTHSVIWRHHDGDVIQARAVWPVGDPIGTDWYRVTLKFMEV